MEVSYVQNKEISVYMCNAGARVLLRPACPVTHPCDVYQGHILRCDFRISPEVSASKRSQEGG